MDLSSVVIVFSPNETDLPFKLPPSNEVNLELILSILQRAYEINKGRDLAKFQLMTFGFRLLRAVFRDKDIFTELLHRLNALDADITPEYVRLACWIKGLFC